MVSGVGRILPKPDTRHPKPKSLSYCQNLKITTATCHFIEVNNRTRIYLFDYYEAFIYLHPFVLFSIIIKLFVLMKEVVYEHHSDLFGLT
jgi:hypothetical protein